MGAKRNELGTSKPMEISSGRIRRVSYVPTRTTKNMVEVPCKHEGCDAKTWVHKNTFATSFDCGRH